jgi:hypothetical protein
LSLQEDTAVQTECNTGKSRYEKLDGRLVEGEFNGGSITSDAGGLLLRELESHVELVERFASCFIDHRDARFTEFKAEELVAQRLYGLCLGYEDLNDHDELRRDPLLATLANRRDPTGQDRKCEEDKGCSLAGKSTLNRLELTEKGKSDKYKKIELVTEQVEPLFWELFIESHDSPPEEIVLDLDATDDPLHGDQEGRFFHGYYRNYCYLPLYIFCGEFLLSSQLRPSNIDAPEGCLDTLSPLVAFIHEHWPETRIILRGDSAFCRDYILDWCEVHPSKRVDYVFGIAKNPRLQKHTQDAMNAAQEQFEANLEKRENLRLELEASGVDSERIQKRLRELPLSARQYVDFRYRTHKTWSRERRVIGKAEYLRKGPNPRFVVTSLSPEKSEAQPLYEERYCARGDMENRLKENQLYLFADRTSTTKMHSNQIRLWFSSMAYMLMVLLRRHALKETPLEKAQCQTIRLKLFKVGAQVQISVRRVFFKMATGYPYKDIYLDVLTNIKKIPALRNN